MLECMARHRKVFPLFFPRFHVTGDYILMLNDDVLIEKSDFLERVC